jgi:hypothetical protein
MSEISTASVDRIRKFTENALKEYETSSVVKGNFNWRAARSNERGGFVRIGWRFLSDGKPFIDEYSRGDNYYAPEILGVGRSVAIGEESYLIRQLEKFFTPKKSLTRAQMVATIESVSEPLTVAFVPIEYFKEFQLTPPSGMTWDYRVGVKYMKIGHHRMKVYWSHKYVKFSRFMFLAQDAIEWIVKTDPKSGQWLKVEVTPEKMKKFVVNLETVALCRLANKEHGIAVNLHEKTVSHTTDAVLRR